MKIPKLIHQTWKDELVPFHLAKYIASWITLNPAWQYVFWTDSMLDEFIRSDFPKLYDKYCSLPIKVMKIDLARYCLMQKHGGVYVDLDFECYKPLEDIFYDCDLYLSWEWPNNIVESGLTGYKRDLSIKNIAAKFNSTKTYEHTFGNAILASIPNHEFWGLLTNAVKHFSATTKLENEDVFGLTGPQFLTENFIANFSDSWEIRILDHMKFYPIPWNKPSIDDGYRSNDFMSSFGAHHWAGSWWQPQPKNANSFIRISEILMNPKQFLK